jgi:membrane-associated phospholipid phosphatase
MPRDARNSILASLACALALVPVVLLAYGGGAVETLDRRLYGDLGARDGVAHGLSTAVVVFGDLLPVLGILALLVAVGFAVGRRRQALAAIAVVIGAGLTTQVLKQLLHHQGLQERLLGPDHPFVFSFPSGHITAAASLSVALVLVAPPRMRTAAAAVGAAFTMAMAVSVVILNWHFPSDVLGGLLVVGSWGFAAVAALRLTRPRRPAPPSQRRQRAASGPLELLSE